MTSPRCPAGWMSAVALTRCPVVARDDTTAQALIHELAAQAQGPVRLGIPSRFTSLSRWAGERGLLPAPLTRSCPTAAGGSPGHGVSCTRSSCRLCSGLSWLVPR